MFSDILIYGSEGNGINGIFRTSSSYKQYRLHRRMSIDEICVITYTLEDIPRFVVSSEDKGECVRVCACVCVLRACVCMFVVDGVG